MRPILSIARQQLLVLLKDRSAVIWMVLVPCMYIFVFGNAFNNNNDPSASKATLGIYNQDSGYLSQRLQQSLVSENLAIQNMDSENGDVPPRYIIIPPDFTEQVLNKKKTTVTFKSRPDANLEAGATAEMAVRKAVIRLLVDISEISLQNSNISSESLEYIENRAPLVTVSSINAGHNVTIPTGYNQQVPANIIMITMMIGFIYGASTLVEERQNGILKRIRTGPIAEFQLFLGKLLGVTLVALVQILLLLLLGRILFGVYFGNDPLALILVVFGFALTVGAMGLLLGFIIRDEERVISISVILSIVMSAVSGCWWPLEISPQWMQHIAMVLPSRMALQAMHELISFGNGLSTVWPNILGIFLYGSVFTVLAGWALARYRN